MGTLVPAQGGDASDTYAAEIFTCLGRALVDLGEPTGDLLLAGAAEVLERHGTVLVPWQRPTRVPGRGGLPAVTSSQALGAWLADVARAAVRAVEGSADVSGSGHAPRGS